MGARSEDGEANHRCEWTGGHREGGRRGLHQPADVLAEAQIKHLGMNEAIPAAHALESPRLSIARFESKVKSYVDEACRSRPIRSVESSADGHDSCRLPLAFTAKLSLFLRSSGERAGYHKAENPTAGCPATPRRSRGMVGFSRSHLALAGFFTTGIRVRLRLSGSQGRLQSVKLPLRRHHNSLPTPHC